MKHYILTLAISFITFFAFAEDFEVDGIHYEITSSKDKTCQVISKKDEYSGDINIPAKVKYNGTQYTVTAIYRSAFYYNNKLTSVVIPNTVTEIGEDAFAGCTNLSSVEIPNSIKIIRSRTFFECTKLTSITIPKSVETISGYAFRNCTSLNSVYVEDISAWFKINFSYDSNPLEYAHNLYVDGKLVTKLEISSDVKSIGKLALSGCTSVMSQ